MLRIMQERFGFIRESLHEFLKIEPVQKVYYNENDSQKNEPDNTSTKIPLPIGSK